MKKYWVAFLWLAVAVPGAWAQDGGTQQVKPPADQSSVKLIPEPPAEEAAEPRRIIRYFCRAWKDEKFDEMYAAMSQSYRQANSLDKFTKLYQSDIEATGGLKDENIEATESVAGSRIRLTVHLFFRSVQVKPKKVVVEVMRTPKGYRIVESGILPVDLESL